MRKNDIIEITIKGIDFPSKPYGYYENDESPSLEPAFAKAFFQV